MPGGIAVGTERARLAAKLREYFFSDPTRTAQTVLGLIWLLDAGLQFQSFMYSRGFISMVTTMAAGQPHWLSSSIRWAATLTGHDLTVYNTLFALIQLAIAVGILWRPTVKQALILSFGWAVFVWWFGEAFGMLFMNMAAPFTGAPGAVIVYALIGLIVWPNGRPGGLVGVRGARIIWATLWLLCSYLWLLQASAAPNAIHDMINAAPSGMSWLSSLQDGFASVTQGDGLVLAVILAAVSAWIALGVGFNRGAKELLIFSIVLQLAYWLLGQGFGGIFQGGATDPNAAPLFILLAYTLLALIPYRITSSTTLEPARS